ncbi:multifunctional CCA addition/repair protein [Ottowia sp.]|uniref:multifunctional CCA addition/repair protein n=1 Tax=Ottowia sp. TaxID=1898956 RepID=UPI0025E3F08D|nr:multifunctional CCA addition/repair protein [Ottowia sp.]MBK6616403.1 multifunctional CCA addition/repair protein [Ottowia sp.]
MKAATGKTYLVGGAVRDQLMGREVKDRDWVVVGSTEQALLDAGFTRVGLDFPVFLHPETREEHALARTERKSGPGYKGFTVHADPSVTLEQDLSRRDLTVNAIARTEDGTLVDPYGGKQDIDAKVLRHVSTAFREDPVRVLRVARFAARYAEFAVAEETMALMSEMVAAGEVDSLVSERVWQELAKGLMEKRPSRMFKVLRACGALARVLPELDACAGVFQDVRHHPEVCTLEHVYLVLDRAASQGASLAVRYACLTHDLGKALTPADVLPRHIGHEQHSMRLAAGVSKRLRVPSDVAGLASVVAREHSNVHRSDGLNGKAIVRLLTRCDAFRKPDRFLEVLEACDCDARGRLGLEDRVYQAPTRLAGALRATSAVDTAAVASLAVARGAKGAEIGAAVARARADAISASDFMVSL